MTDRELTSRLVIPITRLLKWAYQPEHRGSGWIGSIAAQRLRILGQLEDSPSLRTLVPETLASAYPKAVSLAAKETGLSPGQFPTLCPYPPESLLDEDFLPEPLTDCTVLPQRAGQGAKRARPQSCRQAESTTGLLV